MADATTQKNATSPNEETKRTIGVSWWSSIKIHALLSPKAWRWLSGRFHIDERATNIVCNLRAAIKESESAGEISQIAGHPKKKRVPADTFVAATGNWLATSSFPNLVYRKAMRSVV